ncbi:16S rRNA (guanine(527)-N(7))-methyltransferase RsmG [Tistrella bauzanensis]|uniref:Ribosomal RNA small subunit methyltransferase G n=1 Tax=Tistrella arctica TaxID=3133430 RepID=A0ABU9YGR3_9PROT
MARKPAQGKLPGKPQGKPPGRSDPDHSRRSTAADSVAAPGADHDRVWPRILDLLPEVPRETIGRLEVYARSLIRWQGAINLVGPATLPELWRRHMLDSVQLLPLIGPGRGRRLVDLGSGAGFPGLVIAALGDFEVHLVESDTRKAIFLRETARAMGITVTVHAQRIERLKPFGADIVTARALAPLDRLFDMAVPLAGPDAVFWFLKGAQAPAELASARACWTMQVVCHRSMTDEDGVILEAKGLSRVQDRDQSR